VLEVEEMILSAVAVLTLCETFALIHGAAFNDNGMEMVDKADLAGNTNTI